MTIAELSAALRREIDKGFGAKQVFAMLPTVNSSAIVLTTKAQDLVVISFESEATGGHSEV